MAESTGVVALDPDRVARVRAEGISADHASALSGTLSLLGEPTRLRILYALDRVEELCVGDLALALGMSEDAVSYGLRLLRTAGLVSSRKQGRVVFYRLAEDFPEPMLRHCWTRLAEMSAATADEM